MANNTVIKPLFDSLEYLNPQELPRHIEIPANYIKDYQQACNFLYSYRGSIATFNAYRREVERLLQWSWFEVEKSLIELKRSDIESFIEFCQNPPSEWIGSKHVTRFIDNNAARIINPEWKPFVATVSKKAHQSGKSPDVHAYALSQKALQAIFSIIGSFYNYLIQEDYVAINPIAQIRQKSKFLRKRQGKTQIRRLSELQWSYVIETAEIMAKETPEHERTLFIMNALYGMYLRISELASTTRWQPQMGHFFKDMDGSWWFKTVGKGNKERDVSVSDAMLAALKRYRMSLNLPALPSPGEETPLLMRLTGKGSINGTRHIRKIVQKCFDTTVLRLHKDNFSEEAEMLMSATVHWLRHTGISEDVKHRPREHVRDDAGHSSSAITDKYIDVEMRARHASAKKKLIKV
jgi:site-specific recombinase XerD